MRKSDLKKAMDVGTPIAFMIRPGRDYPTTAMQATIVSVTAQRWQSSGYGHGKIIEDGIRLRPSEPVPNSSWLAPIVHVERSGFGPKVVREQDTDDIVVASREIIDTWPDYERKRDVILARKNKERDARDAANKRQQDIVERFTAAGFPFSNQYSLQLSVETAERLINRIEGRDD